MKVSGVTAGDCFTNDCYDTVIEKYFAQERFYDAGQGRMLSVNPGKRG